MATLSAGARVAGTAELLEAILLYLNHDEIDLKTLLVSQRTSTTFRNTIRGSLKLRQALYLEPPSVLRGDEEIRSGMNPLLQLDISRYAQDESYSSRYSKWAMSMPLNSQREFSISFSETSGGGLYSTDMTLLLPMTDPSDPAPSALTTVPSWQQMYVFQWPCTAACRKGGRVCHLYTNPTFGDIAQGTGHNSIPSYGLRSMNWSF